jgi:hypothetical protein
MKMIATAIAALMVAATAVPAGAAAPDWSKLPAKSFTVFYPGTANIEWVARAGDHSGAKGLKKGEPCTSCHQDELVDMGRKIAAGQKLEPVPIKGKPGTVAVQVQAAHDGTNLYLRFTWKQPPSGGGEKMDKDNPVKLAFMLEDNQVERARLSGCWEACHFDARTMPEAKDPNKTKYVPGASLATGKFYDLLQWTAKGDKHDGYVADKRVMDGGKALVDAKGEKKGDEWSVVFTRRLTGGEGDVALAPGKVVNFGFALHDDHAAGRFHHVSLGYTLGLDAKADLQANKQ